MRAGLLTTIALLLAVLLTRSRGMGGPIAATSSPGEAATSDGADRDFVYDAASRFNERIIGNIDAIDTALTGILAGAVAIAVVAIERATTLLSTSERVAFALLAASIICCMIGYLVGFTKRVSNRDGVRPRALIADLSLRPREAILGAVQAMADAAEMNLTVRFCKRTLAGTAVFFLVAAVVALALARSVDHMV